MHAARCVGHATVSTFSPFSALVRRHSFRYYPATLSSSPSFTFSGVVMPTAPLVARRHSQVTSNKAEGYYRLANAKQIPVDEGCYEVHTMRGSGPGGQGVNSSSNKVELRVNLELLALSLEDYEAQMDDASATVTAEVSVDRADAAKERVRQLMENIKRNEAVSEKQGQEVLVVTSHEHRSALQNKEDCLQKVREMVRRASWVPPVPADPIQTPSRTITQKKNERRRKSNMNRMRRAARQGQW